MKNYKKKRYDELREKIDFYINIINYRDNVSAIYVNKNRHLSKIVSMKLNAIMRRKKNKNFKKRKNYKQIKKCYSCDKSNHFAKNCKMFDVKSQINIS